MKNGAVVVSAEFGTVESYGQGLIQDYYNSLASADSQMDILVSGVITERSGAEADVSKKQYVSKFVKGSYYDKTVAKVAKSAYDKVAKQLDDEKTTLENVEAAKKYYEEAKTKIDAEYKKVVDAAKVDAKANIAKLYKAAPTTMAATDVAAMKTEAEGKLEAATTLQGIGEVIDSTISKNSPVLVGNYNEIERLRNNAFGSAKSTIKGIYAGDASFDEGSTAESKAAYAALKTQLEGYGIKTMPADVYNEYVTKISSAKSFEYYVDKDDETNYSVSKLEDEAVTAIQDSYDNILSTIRTAVLNSYYKEIDASTALTTEQAKVYCKGDVETAISDWFLTHGVSGSDDASVSGFLSYEADGGLYAVEYKLDEKYTAFQAERLATVKTSVVANLKAALAKVLDNDDLYKAIVTAKVKGKKDVASDATGTDVYADYVAAATALKISTALFTLIRDAANDVDLYVNTTLLKKTTGTINALTKKITVFKKYEADEIVKINQMAATAVSAFLGQVKSEINVNFADGISNVESYTAKYVGQGLEETTGTGAWNTFTAEGKTIDTIVDLSASFEELFYDAGGKLVEGTTMTKINETVTNNNVSNWQGLVESLIYIYRTTVANFSAVDASLAPYSVDDAGLYPIYKNALNGIVSGTITTYEELTNALGGFAAGYATSVSQALSDAKSTLQEVLNAKINSNARPLNVTVAKADYNAWLAVIGETGYECDSIVSVLAWLDDASKSIAAVYGDVSNVGGSDKSTLQDALDLIEAKSLAHSILEAYVADETKYTNATTMKFGIDENSEAAAKYEEDVIDIATTIDGVADAVLTTASDPFTLADLRKSTVALTNTSAIAEVTTNSYKLYKAREDVFAAADSITGKKTLADFVKDLKAKVVIEGDANGLKGIIDALLPDYIQSIKDVEYAGGTTDVAAVNDIFTVAATADGSIVDALDGADDAAIKTKVLPLYKTMLEKEFISFLNKSVLENPSKAKEIRDFAAKVAGSSYGSAIVVGTLTITNIGVADTDTKTECDAWLTAVKGQISLIIG